MPKEIAPPPAFRATHNSWTQRAAVRDVGGGLDGHMSCCGKNFLQSASTAGLSVRRERRADILADRLPIAFDRAALENSSLLPPYQTNHVNSCDIGSGNDNGPDHDPLLILYRHPAASVRWNVLMTSNSRTMSGLLVAVCERPNSFAVSVRAGAEKYLSSSINMTLYPIR